MPKEGRIAPPRVVADDEALEAFYRFVRADFITIDTTGRGDIYHRRHH
jgi:hypothetical protein